MADTFYDTPETAVPHVPARQVLGSAVALWLCYFVLITMRALVVELGEFSDLLWRRALVTLAGIVVTMLAWPLLRRFDGRPTVVRLTAALVIMLPAALALAAVNQAAFAPVEAQMIARLTNQATTASSPTAPAPPTPPRPSVRVRHDLSGNMLIDIDEPDASASGAGGQGSAQSLPTLTANAITLIQNPVEHEGLWRQLTDVALGRYFLLIAWAALYLALGNAEMVRAAERREGEYRRAAKAAELRSLRYQVNPHFLFNTLNSLSALVMTGREQAAERMIQTMSSFYRHSLAADPSADVPLADEIALQRHYLDIEAVRFPDRLKTVLLVPDDLAQAPVPGMILQPLVENSIKYAVAATTRAVTITITAHSQDDTLVLTVADDGPGKTGTETGTGIGLANVRSRLAARFGHHAAVISGPLPQGGYATTLTLPLPLSQP
ncbi:histidine kinase [Novosphingobium sp.]|uniref:histidine kinase n=1 Tax=Novosphingobium sp. TaxID=1874826 RepID=UPI0033401336